MKWDDFMVKNKKVEIVDKELTPTVLANVKDRKKGSIFSIIMIIVIFAIFIAGVYYLPDLAKYVNNYLNPEPNISTPISNTKKEETDNKEDTPKEEEIAIDKDSEMKIDDITIKGISIEANTIKFKVHNNKGEEVNLRDKYYYVQLYDKNKSLKQRIFITEGILAGNDEKELTYDLLDKNVSLISVVKINRANYPAYTVKTNEGGVQVLSCKKDTETVNYYLNNNKVYLIDIIIDVPKTNPNYPSLYGTYQNLMNEYSVVNGVESNVSLAETLNFKTTIDLNTYQENGLNLKTIYNKDTDAKVMKFELEASGYSCN